MSKDRAARSSSLLGMRLGPYVVEELLGEGAMGAVYAATDVHLGRAVALKVIHRKLLVDEAYCERFLREARAAARLNHPHIVQIYAAGTLDGVPYLALELVDGGSVSRYMKRAGGRLPARRALELVRDAARGLAAAHAQGIVHRDVKPDNMLLDSQGRLKLGDFGIARTAHVSDRLTQSGYFVGTPRYSSPEQCRSEDVDGRSDLYALGVCFFEMLTGDVPFTAKTPLALLQRICLDPPPPVRDLAPDTPEIAARIAGRLLEKAPEDRYATAEDLLADIDAAIDVVPTVDFVLAPEEPAGGAQSGEAGSPGSKGAGSRPRVDARVSTEEVRRDLFGDGSESARPRGGSSAARVREAPVEDEDDEDGGEDDIATELARSGDDRIVTFETTLGRLAAIERLAVGGKPVAALRAAALVARDLAARPAVLRKLLARERRDAVGRDPIYIALGRVVAVLRDRGTRFRPVPSLIDAVDGIAALDVSLALLAGDLADLVEARRAEEARDAAAPGTGRARAASLHVDALVRLADLGVGLPLPWKWDELPGAYDEAVVPLDPEGRQQVQTAAAVVAGLLAPAERERLRAWNERRRIVPVVSLENVGAIAGTSAGLPTLLAIIGAWLSLDLRAGVAASGAIDAATVPTLPPPDRWSPAVVERFLAVRIGRVEAVREKVQAALEQCPDVRTVLLPAANRGDLEGDLALVGDLEAARMRVVWVETVEDALGAGIFAPSPAAEAAGLGWIAGGERRAPSGEVEPARGSGPAAAAPASLGGAGGGPGATGAGAAGAGATGTVATGTVATGTGATGTGATGTGTDTGAAPTASGAPAPPAEVHADTRDAAELARALRLARVAAVAAGVLAAACALGAIVQGG